MLPVVIQDLFESGHMVVPGTQSRLDCLGSQPTSPTHSQWAASYPGFAMDGISDGGSDESSDVSLRDYYVEMYACSLQRSGGADS